MKFYLQKHINISSGIKKTIKDIYIFYFLLYHNYGKIKDVRRNDFVALETYWLVKNRQANSFGSLMEMIHAKCIRFDSALKRNECLKLLFLEQGW